MLKFLRVGIIEYKKRSEILINIKQIQTLKGVPFGMVLFLRGDEINKDEEYCPIENGYKSCISMGTAVYYSKLSLDALLEKCDIEVVE